MTKLQTIDHAALGQCTGGAAASGQQQMRDLAQQYCPTTYRQFRSARTITRPMAERCLDEAGLGMFKGSLDRYFPRR